MKLFLAILMMSLLTASPVVAQNLTTTEALGGLKSHAVPGKITVFDFGASWCMACGIMDKHLHELQIKDPNIVVMKIHLKDWDGPLVKKYQIESIPYLVVYNSRGKRVGHVSGADLEALDLLILKAKILW
jgi:thiol:disulfide interchange protein